jgi:hypothetical protein
MDELPSSTDLVDDNNRNRASGRPDEVHFSPSHAFGPNRSSPPDETEHHHNEVN